MDNVGRIVAAERNSIAALELGKANLETQQMDAELISKLEQQVAQLQQEVSQLRGMLVTKLNGTGPTA